MLLYASFKILFKNLTAGEGLHITVVAISGICFIAWLGVIIKRLAKGRPPLPRPYRFAPMVPWPRAVSMILILLWLVVVAAVQVLVISSGLNDWLDSWPYPATTNPLKLASWTVYVVVALSIIKGYGRDGRRSLGLTSRALGRSALLGAGAYLVLVGPCVLLVVLFTLFMERAGAEPALPEIFEELAGTHKWWVLALAIIQAGILIPFFEEFFFRGIMQGAIMRAVSPAGAILLTSVLFAAAHFTQPQSLPSIFLLSLGLGYTFYRSRSLIASWTMHSLFNTVFVIVAWLG